MGTNFRESFPYIAMSDRGGACDFRMWQSSLCVEPVKKLDMEVACAAAMRWTGCDRNQTFNILLVRLQRIPIWNWSLVGVKGLIKPERIAKYRPSYRLWFVIPAFFDWPKERFSNHFDEKYGESNHNLYLHSLRFVIGPNRRQFDPSGFWHKFHSLAGREPPQFRTL